MGERARRAVTYVRISRDKRRGSLDEGLGVADQEQQCRELAERLGYLVAAVFCDNDISAYSGKPRPQYLRMLELLRSGGADVVLCWHTDRLHRSNAELEDYINGVEPARDHHRDGEGRGDRPEHPDRAYGRPAALHDRQV